MMMGGRSGRVESEGWTNASKSFLAFALLVETIARENGPKKSSAV
jgi:hypothetical protein